MRTTKFKQLVKVLCIYFLFFACTVNKIDDSENIEYENLKGIWINKESLVLQFLDFYSESQARFGLYSKKSESYDPFNYRLINSNQIGIDFLEDNVTKETIHDLIRIDAETIAISDLTIIPENPDITYLKRELITEKINDTIIIGYNQVFYDFENDIRLQLDSVKNDSRCPSGANCVWEGDAETQLNLIIEGNYQHELSLNTNAKFKTDTLIGNINYKLVGLIPYPEIGKNIEPKDYKVKILIEMQ